MLKVVIIDDETLIRIGLKSIINWNKENMDVCGEAANGKTGCELIKKLQPDIVICDIKMPVMNGFEMIRYVTEDVTIIKKPQYIILSSYEEFEFAKTALKLEVCDYIIKLDLDAETLLNSINIAKDKILKIHGTKQNIQSYICINQNTLTENFFKKIILKEINKSFIDKELKILDLKISIENVFVIFLELKNCVGIQKYNFEEFNLLMFSIINISDEISNSYYMSYSFKWSSDNVIILLSSENNNVAELRETVILMCNRLKEMLFNYFNLEVTLCISSFNHSIYTLCDAIKECLFCSDFKKSTNKNIIFFEHEIKSDQSVSIVKKAKDYVQSHYKEKINLSDVSSYLNISLPYLSLIFKKNTGKGFNEFLTEVKINEAKRLIIENKYMIYEISDILGFENPFYFSKVFKKVTGMSPSKYLDNF